MYSDYILFTYKENHSGVVELFKRCLKIVLTSEESATIRENLEKMPGLIDRYDSLPTMKPNPKLNDSLGLKKPFKNGEE